MKRTRSLSLIIAALTFLCARPLTSQQSQTEPQKGKPKVIPTRFEANRFVAVPITTDDVTLQLFTDSAGGLFLYEDTLERLKLAAEVVLGDNGNQLKVVSLPAFKPEHSIPKPLGS